MKANTIMAIALAGLLAAPAGGAWAAEPKADAGSSGPMGMMGGPDAGVGGCSATEGGPRFLFHEHGHGMGPGMMGMMGGPMMGDMGALWRLDLTDEQLAKVRTIQRDLVTQSLKLHAKVLEEKSQLPKLYAATPMDAAAIGKVYGRIFGLYQQLIQQGIEAGNQVTAVLTPEQRKRFERYRSGLMMEGHGMMGGMGMGMMGD